MALKFLNDSIADNSAVLALSSAPLIVLGNLGATIPLYSGCIIGGAAITVFLIRLIMLFITKRVYTDPNLDNTVKDIVGFPIPFATAIGIVEYATSKPIASTYYLPLGLLIIYIAAYFINRKKAA